MCNNSKKYWHILIITTFLKSDLIVLKCHKNYLVYSMTFKKKNLKKLQFVEIVKKIVKIIFDIIIKNL